MAKKISDIKTLSFVDSVKELAANLPERTQQILFDRYGISNGKKITLEGIGKKFGITRERVRQVVKEACKKVKNQQSSSTLQVVKEDLLFAVKKSDGIIKAEKALINLGGGASDEQGAARFYLECLDEIRELEIKGELEKSFAEKDFDLEKWKKAIGGIESILKEKNKTFNEKDLFRDVSKYGVEEIDSKEKMLNYIDVSVRIKKNSFDKWGLADWKEISPKGTREKAYLVLKEFGKPMHFREIAKGIDENNLSKKKTHPQTVHNELIKDSKFVLVGRGVYALSEWGFEKGTVKEVIVKILAEKDASMNREEIIAEVLKKRKVKKSTVIINLNSYFAKSKEGKYRLKK